MMIEYTAETGTFSCPPQGDIHTAPSRHANTVALDFYLCNGGHEMHWPQQFHIWLKADEWNKKETFAPIDLGVWEVGFAALPKFKRATRVTQAKTAPIE
jgi:hypothetical protein